MKVTIIIDKIGTAIHRLALPIKKYNPHIDIEICDLHPKRPSEEQVKRVATEIRDSDIVDIHYWKSGELIKDLVKDKKKILFHFNPYDLDKNSWDGYDLVVVGNEEMRVKLPKAKLIPYGIDLDFFSFNNEYKNNKSVIMVANRIESSKGILEVATACKELGFEFILVGNVSDGAYFHTLMELKNDKFKITFYEGVSDESLREAYYQAGIFVCNSRDNFESGTLPILEAMACGVPILTRSVGHVPDLYNGDNMMINPEPKENIESIKARLTELFNNYDLRIKYRNKAWATVKNYYDRKMARQISNMYYRIIGNPFVSIIIPTFNRPKVLAESLTSAIQQDYPFKEIIVVDSSDAPIDQLISEARKITTVPIKYIYFKNSGEYTLPKARNLAVIEAQGEYLLFCDDRIKMKSNALSEFAKRISFRTWLYGMKDEAKKDFVENFSFIKRSDLLYNGGFNERIDSYGGTSEELRRRFGHNGYIFELVPTAHANQIAKSSARWLNKKDIIRSKFIIHKLYETA